MESNEIKSKSQLKREMLELQSLGEQLIKLSTNRLAKLPLGEILHKAVREAKTITSHEALRRQLQYIGKLMRHCDPKPIQKALAEFSHTQHVQNARFHLLEKWRERLITEGDQALTEYLDSHPHANPQQLRQLIRNAQHELKLGKSPKYQRELFNYLRNNDDNVHEP